MTASPAPAYLTRTQERALALTITVVTANAYYIHPIIGEVARGFSVSEAEIGLVPALNQLALALGILLLLMGLALLAGGIKLSMLGGSLYYLLAGIGIALSGILMLMRRRAALGLYAIVLFASTVWALWEVGLDWWQLVPRLAIWFAIGVVLLLPWARRPLIGPAAKANTALDKAVGWDKLKPDMVKLYTTNFSESELKDLVAFYQSPLGKKVLEKMPQLTQQSAQMTQAKLESAVPVVNKLLADMTAELDPKAAAAAKKKP